MPSRGRWWCRPRGGVGQQRGAGWEGGEVVGRGAKSGEGRPLHSYQRPTREGAASTNPRRLHAPRRPHPSCTIARATAASGRPKSSVGAPSVAGGTARHVTRHRTGDLLSVRRTFTNPCQFGAVVSRGTDFEAVSSICLKNQNAAVIHQRHLSVFHRGAFQSGGISPSAAGD